jgi:Holliday junction resolvase RusA-like endonuclease
MTETIRFWLPFPPSTNRLWRYDRGRLHLSGDYARWKRKADQAALEQGLDKASVLGRHTLAVKLSTRFCRHRGDADNRLKAVLDWCQCIALILDDGDCRKASVEWADIDRDCIVTLTGETSHSEFARLIAARRKGRCT